MDMRGWSMSGELMELRGVRRKLGGGEAMGKEAKMTEERWTRKVRRIEKNSDRDGSGMEEEEVTKEAQRLRTRTKNLKLRETIHNATTNDLRPRTICCRQKSPYRQQRQRTDDTTWRTRTQTKRVVAAASSPKHRCIVPSVAALPYQPFSHMALPPLQSRTLTLTNHDYYILPSFVPSFIPLSSLRQSSLTNTLTYDALLVLYTLATSFRTYCLVLSQPRFCSLFCRSSFSHLFDPEFASRISHCSSHFLRSTCCCQ